MRKYKINIKTYPSIKSQQQQYYQQYFQLRTQGVLDYKYIIQVFYLLFITLMLNSEGEWTWEPREALVLRWTQVLVVCRKLKLGEGQDFIRSNR